MVSVKVVAFAGVAALFTTTAHAADMPQMMPPTYVPQIEEATGWYLRGDIGMSNQRVKSLFNVLYDQVDAVNSVQKGFDSAPFFGLGIGYQFNSWFRVDLTGEYRGRANFHGLDIVSAGGGFFTDEYRFSKSEWLVLANIYADLGTWYSFTPFVGVGFGGSRNTVHDFLDVCTVCPGGSVAHGADTSKWNFAWALHAGVAYKVNSAVSIEFAYRYVHLGDALSGDLVTFQGGNMVNNPMEFRGLTSHDLKLGVRWMLEPPMPSKPYMMPPLMRRG